MVQSMNKRSLKDDGESFDVTVCEAAQPCCSVLFAVGAGGNPERHLALLSALAEHGCNVAAPHFERIVSAIPSASDLLRRARRLRLTLESVARPGETVAGIGHSIGAMLLIALAGGQAWTHDGQRLAIQPDPRIDRLALFAPATDFFRAPGALHGVRASILAWAGASDVITPPAQATFLKHAIDQTVRVDVRVVEGAGHFSFMNTLPAQLADPLPDREIFLARLSSEVCRFVTSPA